MDETNPAAGGGNWGLNTRGGNFNASRGYRVIGPPQIDLFHQEKIIPPGVKLHLQLGPTRPPFLLKNAAPHENAGQAQYKFNILSAWFLVQFSEVFEHDDTGSEDTVLIKLSNASHEVNSQDPNASSRSAKFSYRQAPQGLTS